MSGTSLNSEALSAPICLWLAGGSRFSRRILTSSPILCLAIIHLAVNGHGHELCYLYANIDGIEVIRVKADIRP